MHSSFNWNAVQLVNQAQAWESFRIPRLSCPSHSTLQQAWSVHPPGQTSDPATCFHPTADRLAKCRGLHVCAPPPGHVLRPSSPQWWYSEVRSWGVTGPSGWSPHRRGKCLSKMSHEWNDLSAIWGHTEKVAVRKLSPEEGGSHQNLTKLAFPASRTGRNEWLVI